MSRGALCLQALLYGTNQVVRVHASRARTGYPRLLLSMLLAIPTIERVRGLLFPPRLLLAHSVQIVLPRGGKSEQVLVDEVDQFWTEVPSRGSVELVVFVGINAWGENVLVGAWKGQNVFVDYVD